MSVDQATVRRIARLARIKLDEADMALKTRRDVVTDGGNAALVLSNAPASQDGFFVVPKVVE
jgi:aspartyl-tRNA(Asn)/glutamyl-tRNA(Gln) amidotransferase subunit C